MLEKLKSIAKELEQKLSQSMANHNSLVGYAQAINDAIKIASEVSSVVAPGAVSASLDAAETLANEVMASIETPAQPS